MQPAEQWYEEDEQQFMNQHFESIKKTIESQGLRESIQLHKEQFLQQGFENGFVEHMATSTEKWTLIGKLQAILYLLEQNQLPTISQSETAPLLIQVQQIIQQGNVLSVSQTESKIQALVSKYPSLSPLLLGQ